MMLFKPSFGLTRSLSILHVRAHDRPDFGMLTVETAVFDRICWFSSSRDRKGQDPVEYYLESVEEYSEVKLHRSEPEPGNENVNTVYFVNQAREILDSVVGSLSTMNEHAIANVISIALKGASQPHLYFCLHARVWLVYFIRRSRNEANDCENT